MIFTGASADNLDNLAVNAVGDNSSRTVFVVAQVTDGVGGTLFTSRTSLPVVDTMQRADYGGTNYVYSDGYALSIAAAHSPGSTPFISAYIQNSTSGFAANDAPVGTLTTQLNGVPDTLTGNTVNSESNGGTGFSIGYRLDYGQGFTGQLPKCWSTTAY